MAAMALAVVSTSCSGRGDDVIPPEDMAYVLADIYMAESVVEINHGQYPTDSSRMALKQSILERRGYTLAQLDSSFMWYGANLDEYDKVHTATTRILARRLEDLEKTPDRTQSKSWFRLDSTDVWPGVPVISVSDRSATNIVRFDLGTLADTKRGDMYTWRLKAINNAADANWTVGVEYSDSVTEWIPMRFSGDGWHEITLYCDSNKMPERVYGTLQLRPAPGTIMYLDSIQLIRGRLDSERYKQRYRQRRSHDKN